VQYYDYPSISYSNAQGAAFYAIVETIDLFVVVIAKSPNHTSLLPRGVLEVLLTLQASQTAVRGTHLAFRAAYKIQIHSSSVVDLSVS